MSDDGPDPTLVHLSMGPVPGAIDLSGISLALSRAVRAENRLHAARKVKAKIREEKDAEIRDLKARVLMLEARLNGDTTGADLVIESLHDWIGRAQSNVRYLEVVRDGRKKRADEPRNVDRFPRETPVDLRPIHHCQVAKVWPLSSNP